MGRRDRRRPERIDQPEAVEVFTTPFRHLDFALGGGFRRGELVVVGGRPSMGKSANALRTGSRMDVYRLAVGGFAKPLSRVERAARAYRRDLESACVDAHDGVSVTMAHFVDLAVSAEAHAGVCRWLLRHRLDKLTSAEVVTCSAAIVKAREARNRAVRELDLDKAPVDIWEQLDRDRALPAPEATGPPETNVDAPGARTRPPRTLAPAS